MKREQEQARRARIARAAFELFARAGVEATSIQDIANAAYVSRTNLYRYFPSKTHMLLAHFEQAVCETRQEALGKLHAGNTPHMVWQLIATRMADLGVRYRHLVGAVGQAVLGGPPQKSTQLDCLPVGVQQELQTAGALIGTLEPVFGAMKAQGYLAAQIDTRLLATIYVDSCLLSLMHGGQRSQQEVLRDWEERLMLLMDGALRTVADKVADKNPNS